MKITIIGAGYVGLVTGACLAEMGNHVVCLDVDAQKIRMLNEGGIPIHEPGLKEVVHRNVAAGRLQFTTDGVAAVAHGTLQFIGVGTPPDEDGSADLKYVLAHIHELVVKEVHGAGGYGMLVGPAASKAEIAEFRAVLKADPSNYIAQPTLSLSSCPTFVDSGIAPRHIDLRPYVLSGRTVQTVPGGLTRVALKDGSLVVNSSQGGGTKDTWVLED